MKPTSFKPRKIALLILTGTAFLAFPTAARAFVTLTSNQWVVTSGTGTSVVIAGTLTTNGALNANGTLTAGTLNAGTLLTTGTVTSTGQLWAKWTSVAEIRPRPRRDARSRRTHPSSHRQHPIDGCLSHAPQVSLQY